LSRSVTDLAGAMLYHHVWTAAIALLTHRGAPSGRLNGLDRLGCRFLAKSLGQVADLGFWVAAVAAQGLQEGQLAFLGLLAADVTL
jgi:hypothetical protein